MRKITAAMAGGMLALALLAGCTGSEDDDGPSGPGDDTGARIETTSSVGKVAGKLGEGKRQRVLADVTAVVDGWLDASYVEGDYPRSDFGDAFPGFTKRTARLAAKDRKVMSNARVGEKVERIDVVKRRVAVDVLAPGGKPAGATARVVLVVKLSGEVERTDRIRGRLMLTPAGDGWKVFGFDVRRNPVKGKQ